MPEDEESQAESQPSEKPTQPARLPDPGRDEMRSQQPKPDVTFKDDEDDD